MADEVILYDYGPCLFGMRVRIFLVEKEIDFEFREENPLYRKRPLLLTLNPVHKMVPVLVHNGKPICESLIILQYIDEVWKDKPSLLPSDPYELSYARFWADFADKKIYWTGRASWKPWGEKGYTQEEAKKEYIESLKMIEEQLGEKPYFAGESFGFLDVALIPYSAWFYAYETAGNFSVEKECPKLMCWVKRCMERESVSKALPDPIMVYEFLLLLKKLRGVE
ncbi:probable glutathione S-transferase [Macadamia integrifolia]|uniref:probable glutathione S-transferase n=1 Tax=Macadamia integrifolia TaxID=60698 RepID=UPI001C530EA2|nr:probable glutathione S-transferase [Macadamia integrifolia]